MALGIFPTTFFFRMGQSESLFLLTCVGAMYAMERQAHPLVTALIIGLGTATRPVGILLLGPFALHLWQQHRGKNPRTSLFRFVGGAAIWLPLSCWGIAAFMVFQYATFGDALGFFHTQQHCGQRPAAAYWEQWSRALVLEPIWSVYDPSSAAYWANRERAPGNPLGNLAFANPIYCVISAALVAVGWRKGWLNGRETLLAALLLAIPYLTHSHRNLMLSQGRFAAVAFPVYLVLGRLMACAPLPLVVVGCSLSGFLLITYAALFAAGYELN
jgi:Gpi18-like mannosyltransferase